MFFSPPSGLDVSFFDKMQLKQFPFGKHLNSCNRYKVGNHKCAEKRAKGASLNPLSMSAVCSWISSHILIMS